MTEHQLQRALYNHWRLKGTPNSTFIHLANEGKRSTAEGWRLKQIGLTPGLPDVLLRGDPDYLERGVMAEPFFLELKRPGVVATPERRLQLEGFVEKGWLVWTINSLDAALALLREHAVLKNNN
jgi:hypothetical protein